MTVWSTAIGGLALSGRRRPCLRNRPPTPTPSVLVEVRGAVSRRTAHLAACRREGPRPGSLLGERPDPQTHGTPAGRAAPIAKNRQPTARDKLLRTRAWRRPWIVEILRPINTTAVGGGVVRHRAHDLGHRSPRRWFDRRVTHGHQLHRRPARLGPAQPICILSLVQVDEL